MADDPRPARLARIEAEIATHRKLYLDAYHAGHMGEADWHETEVDRLLILWQKVQRNELAIT
jgi:hypothetical protein